jgi:hypothetical protein
MTSGRSDDCKSLPCSNANKSAARGRRRRSRIPRTLVRVPNQQPHDDKRSLRRLQELAMQLPDHRSAGAFSPVWWQTYAPSRAGRAFPPVWLQTHAPSRAGRTFAPVWLQTHAPSRPGRTFSPVWWQTHAPNRAGRAFPPVWLQTHAPNRAGRAFAPVWWQTYAPEPPRPRVSAGLVANVRSKPLRERSLSGLRTGPFHAPGLHGREWQPGFEGGTWG